MFYKKFNLLFQDVVLIGCGGTGSRVIPPLIQEIKQAQAKISPCLYLIDGDEVEYKNLARQNFIEPDVGRNKATVLAERYGTALDFHVVAMPEFIDTDTQLNSRLGHFAREQGYRSPTSLPKLIIMCVDSINARLKILDKLSPKDIVIDAGNEDTFGQVSIFNMVSIPHSGDNQGDPVEIKPFNGEYELPFIPAPVSAYLDALVNPSPATGSCADLDQSLAVNFMMAAGIINYVQNLAYNNKFYCRTSFFDLIKGNSSERMTPIWFNQVMNETKVHHNAAVCRWSEAFQWNASRTIMTQDLVNDINEKMTFIDPRLLALLGK